MIWTTIFIIIELFIRREHWSKILGDSTWPGETSSNLSKLTFAMKMQWQLPITFWFSACTTHLVAARLNLCLQDSICACKTHFWILRLLYALGRDFRTVVAIPSMNTLPYFISPNPPEHFEIYSSWCPCTHQSRGRFPFRRLVAPETFSQGHHHIDSAWSCQVCPVHPTPRQMLQSRHLDLQNRAVYPQKRVLEYSVRPKKAY